ncbi:AAA family ATPase [Nitrospira sp. BLG_1]|uniref:AAA family ATPase n=1 Tax=Nitrospira sp. BLG_1 TaxID=3395883 RepID=UPI0039BD8592
MAASADRKHLKTRHIGRSSARKDKVVSLIALQDRHREELQDSGLSDATIKTAGLYSASKDQVSEILGLDAGPGLVFPYAFQTNGYARVKLDDAGRDGKRYRSPKGSTNHLYIPATLASSILSDVRHPIYITEGEKKALKGCQEGLSVVALAGVWSWRTRTEEQASQPIPDLARLTWAGRKVYLVFDSDIRENEEVRRAETALAEELARRQATVFAIRLPDQGGTKVGLDDFLATDGLEAFRALEPIKLKDPVVPIGIALDEFLTKEIAPTEELVEGILSAQSVGWIAGEEKLGKTFYALEEALCLAIGQPVCNRFTVPTPRRVLFIEEEDPIQRVQTRLRALLRGHGLDLQKTSVRDMLRNQFRIEVWAGFNLDNSDQLARLRLTLDEFKPEVVYLDCLRKLSSKDLNKANEAGTLLATLDDLRRQYGVIFRVIHHFRKNQGGRVGRGSQEIGGSFVLGAWGEDSLFFEPISRNQAGARLSLQRKDSGATGQYTMTIESEGPAHEPTSIRLRVDDVSAEPAAEQLKERVYEAITTLPTTEPLQGKAGVTLKSIQQHLKRKSDKPIREALRALHAEEQITKVGQGEHNADLWAVQQR